MNNAQLFCSIMPSTIAQATVDAIVSEYQAVLTQCRKSANLDNPRTWAHIAPNYVDYGSPRHTYIIEQVCKKLQNEGFVVNGLVDEVGESSNRKRADRILVDWLSQCSDNCHAREMQLLMPLHREKMVAANLGKQKAAVQLIYDELMKDCKIDAARDCYAIWFGANGMRSSERWFLLNSRDETTQGIVAEIWKKLESDGFTLDRTHEDADNLDNRDVLITWKHV